MQKKNKPFFKFYLFFCLCTYVLSFINVYLYHWMMEYNMESEKNETFF